MEGICPKCSAHYYGWALNNPLEQKCEICGSLLEISEGKICLKAYQSPFNYPKYEMTSNEIRELIRAN